jgi:hypothetical protein
MKKPDVLLEQYYLNEKEPDGTPNELSAAMDAIAKSNADILAAYPAADMKAAVMAKLSSGSARNPSGDEVAPVRSQDADGNLSRPRVIREISRAGRSPRRRSPRASSSRLPRRRDDDRRESRDPRGKRFGGHRDVDHEGKRLGIGAVYLQAGRQRSRTSRIGHESVSRRRHPAQLRRRKRAIRRDHFRGRSGHRPQHYPEYDGIAAMLLPRGETSLDFAYKLDNAPRFERFFFLTGNAPFSTQQFQMRLSEAAKSAKSPDFEIPDVLKGKVTITDITLLNEVHHEHTYQYGAHLRHQSILFGGESFSRDAFQRTASVERYGPLRRVQRRRQAARNAPLRGKRRESSRENHERNRRNQAI